MAATAATAAEGAAGGGGAAAAAVAVEAAWGSGSDGAIEKACRVSPSQLGPVPGTRTEFSICFTSVSPEIDSLFRSLLSQSPGIVAEPRDLTRRKRSRAAG